MEAEREKFEAWWFDPKSADNTKSYCFRHSDVDEVRRLSADVAWSAWQAGRAAQAAAVKVPDGFALVPLEPTKEMVAAAFDAVELGEVPGFHSRNDARRTIYRAMVAAAAANTPTPTPGDKHE